MQGRDDVGGGVSALTIQLKWMLLPLFCQLTGYTDKAVRRKIEDGVWLQGRHFRKAPDGGHHHELAGLLPRGRG